MAIHFWGLGAFQLGKCRSRPYCGRCRGPQGQRVAAEARSCCNEMHCAGYPAPCGLRIIYPPPLLGRRCAFFPPQSVKGAPRSRSRSSTRASAPVPTEQDLSNA